MPFTFAHPAIVLPFLQKHRRLLSATGLVIGSIAPDFESFIGLTDIKHYSHSWKGMFWYDMPLAFILAVVFHVVIRDPLILHLPASLQKRFAQYVGFNFMKYLRGNLPKILLSLFIGILSHLLWDGCTHLNLRYPDSYASMTMLGPVRLYIFLQYACSVIGLLVVAWCIYKMPVVPAVANNKGIFRYWLFIALVWVFIFIFIKTCIFNSIEILNVILLIDFSISSVLAALLVVSLVYRLFPESHNS